MALHVVLGDRDVTDLAGELQFSSVDPGGYEACSFTLPAGAAQPQPGTPIRIYEGLQTCWWGQVEDPGPHDRDARAAGQVQGVGDGVLLKDNPYRCIYVDRDLSAFTRQPSRQRLINLATGATKYETGSSSIEVAPDASLPAVVMRQPRINCTTTERTLAECWYDAQGLPLDRIYYDMASANVGGGWQIQAFLSTDDVHTAFDVAALAVGGQAGYLVATAGNRDWATLQMYYDAPTLTADGEWAVTWRKLAVYGDHGLTRRGPDPGGFYPADIADHARAQARGVARGVVDVDPTAFIVPHSVYREATMPEQVVDDMAKLLGWHWGVWEPLSLTGSRARLDFRARPTAATAWVSRSDCHGLKTSERRSQLYDMCIVRYADAAGTPGQVTVQLANPRMPAGASRTLGPLDMGAGSPAAAQLYATAALGLAQAGQRGGGSPSLPATVGLPGGGTKPAHLLKAGLDRLRIVDLPDSGPLHAPDARRFDTFRIKRVETTVKDGAPRTTAELDDGADLLETLNAGLAIAAGVAGAR